MVAHKIIAGPSLRYIVERASGKPTKKRSAAINLIAADV